MKPTKFKVLEVCDIRKHNSEVEVGAVLTAESIVGNSVYFTDKANVHWIFYINETCELI